VPLLSKVLIPAAASQLSIKITVYRRELVAFGTVETRICRHEVPNHIMRYKSIGYKMLKA
jgi:hypothetical protein